MRHCARHLGIYTTAQVCVSVGIVCASGWRRSGGGGGFRGKLPTEVPDHLLLLTPELRDYLTHVETWTLTAPGVTRGEPSAGKDLAA